MRRASSLPMDFPMFQSKTIFVVGAGASKEVGLPIGAELRDIIGEKLRFTFDHHNPSGGPKTGDRPVFDSLLWYAHQTKQNFDDLVHNAQWVSKAMPQA